MAERGTGIGKPDGMVAGRPGVGLSNVNARPSFGSSGRYFGTEGPHVPSITGHETGFVATRANGRRTGPDTTNYFSASAAMGFPLATSDAFSGGMPSGGAQVPASKTSLNMDPEEKRRLAEAAAKALTAK